MQGIRRLLIAILWESTPLMRALMSSGVVGISILGIYLASGSPFWAIAVPAMVLGGWGLIFAFLHFAIRPIFIAIHRKRHGLWGIYMPTVYIYKPHPQRLRVRQLLRGEVCCFNTRCENVVDLLDFEAFEVYMHGKGRPRRWHATWIEGLPAGIALCEVCRRKFLKPLLKGQLRILISSIYDPETNVEMLRRQARRARWMRRRS